MPIKSLPIYEPCASLTAGTAADDAVAKAIAALKGQAAKARIEATQQLSKACDKRAIDPLLDLFSDPDTSVRVAAAEALGRLGDQDSVQPLMDLLASQNIEVKTAITSAFASFPGFKGRNSVVNQIANPSGADITDEADMRLRCAAILTACQLKDVSHSRKSILFLFDFLNSRHAHIRALAEQTLMELKNTRNGETEMIAIMKQSANPVLRRWAALWIGKIGFIGAREALQEVAANDADPQVKQNAAESLKKLSQ
ncbi:MAG: HEAT repeat domain-containing protein [Blastocatellia bacterium]